MSTSAKERELGKRLAAYLGSVHVRSVEVDSGSMAVYVKFTNDAQIRLRFEPSRVRDLPALEAVDITQSGLSRLSSDGVTLRPRSRDVGMLNLAQELLDDDKGRRFVRLCAQCIDFAKNDALTVDDIDEEK